MQTSSATTNDSSNAWRIFATLMIVYAFFTNTYLTTNDASRFSLTVSLATGAGGEITHILPRTISPGWKIKDFAVRNNKILSDKAPLGSVIAVPFYLVFSEIGLKLPWTIYLVSLMCAAVPTALTALLIYWIVPLWRRDERLRVMMAMTYGLGSMALFYGTVFFSSALTAFCGFGSFFCIAKLPVLQRPKIATVAAGLLAGAAILSDYYAGVTSVCLIAYCFFKSRNNFVLFLLSFLVPIAALFLYHDLVFGAPWPLSYHYGHLFGPLHSKGFYGVTIPSCENLCHLFSMLFSQWGFFFTNLPVIFSIIAYRRFFTLRHEPLIIMLMFIGYLFFNTTLSWFDAYSARFFMPVMPFLILPLMCVKYSNRLIRNLFFFTVGLSIAINIFGADHFLPEYVWKTKHGMQNLAGTILGARGIKLGLWNYAFLSIALLPWLIKRKKQKSEPV